MWGKISYFSTLDETIKSIVNLGNNANLTVSGKKGQITIRLNDGSQNFISYVFYALGLPHNLLSMGRTIVCQRTQHADLLLTCQGKDGSQPSISFENSSRKTFLLEFCDSK